MGNRRGFTFVELLLVIFVLAAAGAGILGSYLSTHYLTQHAKETMIAYDDLRDMMERINAAPFSTIIASFPAGTPNVAAYQAIVSGGGSSAFALQNETITVTYPSQTASRLEILVTVSWNSLGRNRTASLACVRSST